MRALNLLIILFFTLAIQPCEAQSDQELNRDSVIGWQYISNPPKANVVYKPVKSKQPNGATYTAWQQQASDMLINWIQQSYLPRGVVLQQSWYATWENSYQKRQPCSKQ